MIRTIASPSFSKKQSRPYGRERKYFYAAGSLMVVLFIAYVYFVSMSVAHVVVRKELSRDISDTQTRLSELEAAYIAAQQAVDIETALARGFAVNNEKIFVEKADTALVLSRNDTR